ncbi:MAG: mobile mystery protein A [Acidobacteria bacterium]|nr:mobile mystery protein A [Acidobacteriota bacterium]
MPRTNNAAIRKQARESLDARCAELRQALPLMSRPQSGWISAIRQSLGMSQRDLGSRMGIAESTLTRLEDNERVGSIQISTLQRAAEALECDFVYALVPRRSLDDVVTEKARQRVESLIATVAHTMLLEDQAPSEAALQKLEEEAVAQRINRPGLWNDSER